MGWDGMGWDGMEPIKLDQVAYRNVIFMGILGSVKEPRRVNTAVREVDIGTLVGAWICFVQLQHRVYVYVYVYVYVLCMYGICMEADARSARRCFLGEEERNKHDRCNRRIEGSLYLRLITFSLVELASAGINQHFPLLNSSHTNYKYL